jgi:flagellar assembly factor FliW
MVDNITITTVRFGDLEIASRDIIEFPKGLLGFEAHTRFALLSDEVIAPFSHLQSLDDPGLTFVVVDPRLFVPHYRIQIDPAEISDLSVQDVEQVAIWGVVTIPDDMARMSVNLQGPLLINRDNRRGKQLVLVHSTYTTCHYLMDELKGQAERTSERPVALSVP